MKLWRPLLALALALPLLGFSGVGGGGTPKYIPEAWDFNVASSERLNFNEDLNCTAPCSGRTHANGPLGTISFWYRNDTSGGNQIAWSAHGSVVELLNDTAGNWTIILSDAALTSPGSVGIGSDGSPQWNGDGAWHHFMASWDVQSENCNIHLYVDGVNELGGTPTCENDIDIDYTRANHTLGGLGGGSQTWDGCLSDMYVNYWEYIDLSVAANRAKFLDQNNEPVNLTGSNIDPGSHPTGLGSIIYLDQDDSVLSSNSGYSNNSSTQTGITECSDDPRNGF